VNGLLRHSQQGMAHPAGNHHLDYCPGKARFTGGSARGEDQNSV